MHGTPACSIHIIIYIIIYMKMKCKILLASALLLLPASMKSQNNATERTGWFVGDRFGMFIHWGLYSGAEGFWKGEPLRNDNNYAEWIQYRNSIGKSEYLDLIERFKWNEINPEEWVLLAKAAGMKYVVLTAKHHDGFALWNSRVSDYDVYDNTDPHRDILKELADACRKHGMKLGLYYSHWIDWEHEYGWDHTKEISGISHKDYDRYWQGKVIPQMRELLTGYGPIAMIWFDMWIHHSKTVVTREQLVQLKKLIRQLQPNCLINSRLGLSVTEDSDVDIHEMGDNQLGSQKQDFAWQSPATVSHSWGFNRKDAEWKSTTSLLRALINNVSLNGNYLLNIGPKATGEVPFEIEIRLREMGKWMERNGESVYGCGAFLLPKDYHDWGQITSKKTKTGTMLYLHIYKYPLSNRVVLTGVTSKPSKIYILSDNQKKPVEFRHNGASTTINLPENHRDPYITVVAVEYPGSPAVQQGLVPVNTDGGYSFTVSNAAGNGMQLKTVAKQRGGTVPAHLALNEPTVLKWRIYAAEPGEKSFDVSYSFQGNGDKNRLVLKVSDNKISHVVSPSGKTVGEPNSNWVIDRFLSRGIGKVNFPAPGYYDVELEILPFPGEEMKFQWLWME